MGENIPKKCKEHITPTFDSTRWEQYSVGKGDVVISTYPKCGTTWVEYIVLNLRYMGKDLPLLRDAAIWVEKRHYMGGGGEYPATEIADKLARIAPPRQMKTHLPIEYLPYYPEVKYLIVGRDMRDAYVSWHNHLIKTGKTTGDDLHSFWQIWADRGIEGNVPAAADTAAHPHFEFYNSWWKHQERANIHFVHFNNLLSDLGGEVEKIAGFLDMKVDKETVTAIAEATAYPEMKKNSQAIMGKGDWLINKGTNGRWKDVLIEEDLTLYEEKKADAIKKGVPVECLRWLETGLM